MRASVLSCVSVCCFASCAVVDDAVPAAVERAVVADASFDDADVFAAYDKGVVVGRLGDDQLLHLQRYSGVGCDLVAVGDAVVSGEFFDVDDNGAIYAGGPFAVTRIDVDGTVASVISMARWVAAFSISPSGHTAVTSGCSPTGTFAIADDGSLGVEVDVVVGGRTAEFSVLGGDVDFWSTGGGRVWRDGDHGFKELNVDVGSVNGLDACGHGVCILDDAGVVVVDDSGAQRIDEKDVGFALVGVSGNDDGTYVGDGSGRVVFVAR